MSDTVKSQWHFKISKTIVVFIILWTELKTNKQGQDRKFRDTKAESESHYP